MSNLWMKASKKVLKSASKKCIEKGIEKGIEKVLIAFLKKNPDWSDRQVAESFGLPLATVQNVRMLLERQA